MDVGFEEGIVREGRMGLFLFGFLVVDGNEGRWRMGNGG